MRFVGTVGNDTLVGSSASDDIFGRDGNDTLQGGGGIEDYLDGGSGDDLLLAGTSSGSLAGGGGNDTLDGGSGHVYMNGQSGDDLYIVRGRHNYVTNQLDSGDRVEIQADFYKVTPWMTNVSWAPGVQKLPYWIDALVDSSAIYPTVALSSKVVKVCFVQSAPTYFSATDSNGFTPFTAQQIEYTRKALAYISSLIDIRFEETTDPNEDFTIVLANNEQQNSGGYASMIWNTQGSPLMIDKSADLMNPQRDNGAAFYDILMHELGHSLGLKHPFSHKDANGNVGEGPYLPDSEDDFVYTVMSYRNDYDFTPTAEFSPLDVAALQYLWGAAPTLHAGDSIYTIEQSGFGFAYADGGGVDLLSGGALVSDLTLDLRAGYWSHIGAKAATIGAANQFTINFGTVIEDALGGSGNDSITGNEVGNVLFGGSGNDKLDGREGNDWLRGDAGNDVLTGGSGRDYAEFEGKRADYTVAIKDGVTTVTHRSGGDGVDVLNGVERLSFSDLDVALDIDGKSASIFRLYQAAFNRAPDLPGLGFWLKQVDQGAELEKIAFGFTQSDEFTGLYGKGTDDANFVASLYRNALHREHEKAGFDFWMNLLQNGGYTRERVLLAFAESAENQARVAEVIANGFDYQHFTG